MVDLQGQYAKIKDAVNDSIEQVLNTSAYINGPLVHEFQADLEKYLGVKHVIPCANGTDALQIAMMGLGLEQGDEVITADFTFAATVEVIAVANMEAILEIAKEHNLFVIEDNAQAIGATYTFKDGRKQKAGTLGNVGTTSFFPSKNLGCYGDGGAIFTNDDQLAHTIRGIVNHGMYTRYYHDVVGVNSRLDSIQAGVLKTKLPNLDIYCTSRRDAARFYNKAFANNTNIITPTTQSNNTTNCGQLCDSCDCHVFHQYTLQIKNGKRDALHKHLLENNIPNAIYYPVPLHAQKAYKDDRYQEADFKVTNQLIKEVISLPMHTELDQDQLEFITNTILSFIK